MLVISAAKVSPLEIVYVAILIKFTVSYYPVIFVERQGWTSSLTMTIKRDIIKHRQEHFHNMNIVACMSGNDSEEYTIKALDFLSRFCYRTTYYRVFQKKRYNSFLAISQPLKHPQNNLRAFSNKMYKNLMIE